jgi:hypothetical protein
MKTLMFLIGVWFSNEAVAQTPSYLIRAGESPNRVIPFQARYRYPEFRPGSVIYSDGKPPVVKLNYNFLIGEMQFINPDGDTANINNEYTLRYVSIGKDLFFHDYKKGYLEIIADYQLVRLGLQQTLYITRTETIGNNGYVATKELTTGATHVSYPIRISPFDAYIGKDAAYFLIDQNDRIRPAHKSNVLKVFARHKKTIENYLDENRTDFKNVEHLKKLLQFCSNLEKGTQSNEFN